MALVGLVARTIAESPALGVKNLYKKVCETLGERPGSGRAPTSREVRKIVAALKESKGLDTVMDAVSPYTNETKRAALYAQIACLLQPPKSILLLADSSVVLLQC